MKKLFAILLILSITLTLAACTTADGKSGTFELVDKALNNSDTPFKIVTDVVHEFDDAELESHSELLIEKVGRNSYKAKYSYSVQTFNTLDAEQPINTQSDTIYYDGERYGKVTGDNIDWKTGELEGTVPSQFALQESYFASTEYTAIADHVFTFTALLNEQGVLEVFGEELAAAISNVTFTMRINATEKQVVETVVSYSTDTADVTITLTYDYASQTVSI